MKLIEQIHDNGVHQRRIDVLTRHFINLLPPVGSLLDIGCGDGLLASRIGRQLPSLRLTGVDVMVRDQTHIPVREFDGIRLPFDDKSFDSVMLVDVLHHTDDPTILLREAGRVAREAIVIKDHTRNGILAETTLRFMDRVGNARHGVALPFNYWSREQWETAFRELELQVDVRLEKLGLYPIPADWLFGRSLHFIARLTPGVGQ